MSQNLELLLFLLHNTNANPNVNVKDLSSFQSTSGTPLIEACKMKDMNAVRLLLENKSCPADINMADNTGMRPFSVALKSKNLDLAYMLMLISNGKLDLNYAYDRYSPLRYTRRHSFKKPNYCTPLIQAIEMREKDLIKDLIKAGADVNPCNLIEQNIIDYSPLMEAVSQDNLDICSILLQNGSDVNATSSPSTHTKTALTIAAQSQKPNYLAIAALLLEHGAIHPISKCGRSLPMFLALSHNKATLVDLFMKHGYKFRKYPNPQNPSIFRDELCDAIEADSEDCCVTLLQWGFNVKSNDYPYFSTAVDKKMTRLAKMLTQHTPQFLQEGWLIRNDTPALGMDSNANELLHKACEERKQPNTLQELCKVSVLQRVTPKSQQETISTQINCFQKTSCSITAKLHNAVMTDDVKEAKHILHKYKDIDLNRQFGRRRGYTSLLMLACKRGCVDMVKLLTTKRKKPADVNMPDSNGKYPISIAVERQHTKLLAFLLDTNTNPNVRCGNSKGNYTTPLMLACNLGDIDIVKMLVANKADVNMQDSKGACPISVAVMSRNLKLTSFLLGDTKANPNVNIKNVNVNTIGRYQRHFSTPLIEACKMENMSMVKLLLENTSNPADINMVDGIGMRPFSVALKMNNLDLVYMLMRMGDGKLDLNYVCDRNSPLRYTRLVGQNLKKPSCCTPLMQAIGMGEEELVIDLIKAGADVNPYNLIQQNIIDYSPLMEAVSQDNMGKCAILLQNGSDVNAVSSPNTNSKTALIITAQSHKSNYPAIAALMLEHGAIHPISKCGRSLPMYLALSHNKATLVDLFMKHGYKLRKYPCPQNPSVFRDELCDGIEADSEDCCVTLLQWGFNVKVNDYPYFRSAVGQGMTRLVGMLIQLNPQFLQENWLIDNDLPSGTWDNNANELLDGLTKHRKQPKALRQLCKAAVLQNLISRSKHETVSAEINNWKTLPEVIKEFLKFQNEHIF